MGMIEYDSVAVEWKYMKAENLGLCLVSARDRDLSGVSSNEQQWGEALETVYIDRQLF